MQQKGHSPWFYVCIASAADQDCTYTAVHVSEAPKIGSKLGRTIRPNRLGLANDCVACRRVCREDETNVGLRSHWHAKEEGFYVIRLRSGPFLKGDANFFLLLLFLAQRSEEPPPPPPAAAAVPAAAPPAAPLPEAPFFLDELCRSSSRCSFRSCSRFWR